MDDKTRKAVDDFLQRPNQVVAAIKPHTITSRFELMRVVGSKAVDITNRQGKEFKDFKNDPATLARVRDLFGNLGTTTGDPDFALMAAIAYHFEKVTGKSDATVDEFCAAVHYQPAAKPAMIDMLNHAKANKKEYKDDSTFRNKALKRLQDSCPEDKQVECKITQGDDGELTMKGGVRRASNATRLARRLFNSGKFDPQRSRPRFSFDQYRVLQKTGMAYLKAAMVANVKCPVFRNKKTGKYFKCLTRRQATLALTLRTRETALADHKQYGKRTTKACMLEQLEAMAQLPSTGDRKRLVAKAMKTGKANPIPAFRAMGNVGRYEVLREFAAHQGPEEQRMLLNTFIMSAV